MPVEDDDELREILELERVAVVGASTDYEKAAHIVPAFLQRKGYEIVPVNPYADEVFGRPAYASLSDVETSIDIVQIFRPSDEVDDIVDAVLERDDVQTVWMQLGISNETATRRAERAGIKVVQDRCMKAEYGMLMH
ncbi:CoA-binding protein [Natronococcus amylolyticus DSM 10524]|uniref:CoA-binding protein n=1 Tax=Natronococcus amylolyticus DSM 10524 TaxID=1227497 RepID=L9X378_9EURY|nr:CoA-binding protein [Natronococcus amylolyticus]ELY56180.1 CoA-binding protein [Natronococcus amylolyticus DSM 10524]